MLRSASWRGGGQARHPPKRSTRPPSCPPATHLRVLGSGGAQERRMQEEGAENGAGGGAGRWMRFLWPLGQQQLAAGADLRSASRRGVRGKGQAVLRNRCESARRAQLARRRSSRRPRRHCCRNSASPHRPVVGATTHRTLPGGLVASQCVKGGGQRSWRQERGRRVRGRWRNWIRTTRTYLSNLPHNRRASRAPPVKGCRRDLPTDREQNRQETTVAGGGHATHQRARIHTAPAREVAEMDDMVAWREGKGERLPREGLGRKQREGGGAVAGSRHPPERVGSRRCRSSPPQEQQQAHTGRNKTVSGK